jgi:hypothetical protein
LARLLELHVPIGKQIVGTFKMSLAGFVAAVKQYIITAIRITRCYIADDTC